MNKGMNDVIMSALINKSGKYAKRAPLTTVSIAATFAIFFNKLLCVLVRPPTVLSLAL